MFQKSVLEEVKMKIQEQSPFSQIVLNTSVWEPKFSMSAE